MAETHFRTKQAGRNRYKPHETDSLNRAVIHLAIETGIPMSEWKAVGFKGIATAIEILKERNEQINRNQR